MGADRLTQIPQNLSAQAQKFWISMKKASWVSAVRGFYDLIQLDRQIMHQNDVIP